MRLIGKKETLLSKIISELMKLDDRYNYELEVKRITKKRSLKANNYAWELISKIAEAINPPLSKEEVYEQMLQEYGTYRTDENGELITISSVTELSSTPDLHIAYIGKSYIKDKLFYHYRLIKGSSEYNSSEMYKFIEGIKQEAIQLGIEVRSKEEIESMLANMN